ncbi:MAG: dienelactone hydrolase family protein [Fibrobacterota bacterium]
MDDYTELLPGDGSANTKAFFYHVPDSRRGAILVGGIGGVWHKPADALYPKPSLDLAGMGISGPRVGYRDPHAPKGSVHDTVVGCNYLQQQGVDTIGLAGHWVGGAVGIQTAQSHPSVRVVITLSAQTYGALSVHKQRAGCVILFIHGRNDATLPSSCSKQLHCLAKSPRKLVIYSGANHSLDSVSDKVETEIHDWFEHCLLHPMIERS